MNELVCPYCREALATAEALACPRCETAVHAECAALHGRCVTLGCSSSRFEPARPTERRRLEPSLPLTLGRLVALALPLDDAALVALGGAGLAGLAFLLR